MIKLNGRIIEFKQFPNGETFVDINRASIYENSNTIKLKFESDLDLINLKFIKDFVDRNTSTKATTKLIMPYMPYSRMDRQENNRAFTLKSVADFINSLHFDLVEIWEPHSDVSTALLNRVVVRNTSSLLANVALKDLLESYGVNIRYFDQAAIYNTAADHKIYMVYPDAGAEKRYRKQLEYNHVLTCEKHRDFDTGNITGFAVNTNPNVDYTGATAIIVDDLCSRGGTFMGAASALRKLGFKTVILCITHCEETSKQGNLFTSGLIDKVYTTNSIFNEHTENQYTIGKTEIVIPDIGTQV